MTTISAKVVADSVSPASIRITTLELRYPRWIHAEFMTHRQFSRNASSSRAIPVERLIQDVLDDPAVPMFWGANQKGMQAGADCNTMVGIDGLGGPMLNRTEAWLIGMEYAVDVARGFNRSGYHKQLVNRLLEPFSHIRVVVTATEWANFFGLRDHEAAEPHIRLLAQEMKRAMANSTPAQVGNGEWHLPYVSDAERRTDTLADQIRLSVARCASTSYKTVDGEPMTMDRAHALYDRLLSAQPIHASPAEHQATPDLGITNGWRVSWEKPHLHGNFRGWLQYRKTLPGECIAEAV